MKILRPINNNVVTALDEKGREVVIMGKGIGFKAKVNNEIPDGMIEKVFRMDSKHETDKLTQLLADLPLEHIQISAQIIDYAKKTVDKRLNKNVYITLTDHINFALHRFHEGMILYNHLVMEVRSFYPQEYAIGVYALTLIEQTLGIALPRDEAASVALHIVNAEYNTTPAGAMDITRMIQSILQIVRDTFGIRYNETSLHYERFITHLKYLTLRILKNQPLCDEDLELAQTVQQLYPQEYACSEKIRAYLNQTCNFSIANEELAYLTLHIHRIQRQAASSTDGTTL